MKIDERAFEKLWGRVNKTMSCWEWCGPLGHDGYGLMNAPRVSGVRATWRVHRLSWTQAHGPIPAGLLVCHKCDNRKCVRPDHLFLGTERDNFHDCLEKGRYSPKGSGNAAAKLSPVDVLDIRANYALCRVSQRELGLRYGVSQSAISAVVRGKTWGYGT